MRRATAHTPSRPAQPARPTVNRVPSVTLGVTAFGQSGALEDVYRYHGIDADSIVRAALDAATA